LAPSTKTLLTSKEAGRFAAGSYGGRNFHFGIREHAMASASNGMALCGLRPYAATFFVFSDYLRPAMRLSALMGLPVTYVFTHDSIGVGEDGPTHQPVEQLAAARAIPGLVVLRPADANETVQAWKAALAERRRPTALVLTRQNLPTFDRASCAPAAETVRGGYVLRDAAGGAPQVLLLATGSEVALAMAAQEQLAGRGIQARVVSLPSLELFADQTEQYRRSVLPPGVRARVAVEAGVRQGWEGLLGDCGEFVGMSGFGASAPAATVFEKMGITVEGVVAAAERALAKARQSPGC
jgi:transketolase